MHTLGDSLTQVLNPRSVAEIQRNIVKRGKRSPVSRLFHARDDKEAIAAWRLELSMILHVFNVRPVTPLWSSPTIRFQTELSINTHVVVSDIRHDVVNTHTIVSDVHQGVVNANTIISDLQYDVTNTHAIVSEIRRNMVTGQEGTSGQNHPVSANLYPTTTQCSPFPRLKSGHLFQILCSPLSYLCTACLPESCLPHRQGPVLDVTT